MAWVDNQKGQWVWMGEPGAEQSVPKPTVPPNSAYQTQGYDDYDSSYQPTADRNVTPEFKEELADPPVNPAAPSNNSQVDVREQVINDELGATQDNRQLQTDSIVDRYSAIQLDTGPADQARKAQQQGMDMQKAIYDKLMAFDPNAAAQSGAQRSMNDAMVMARSAGGGAAARQNAQFQAMQALPGMQAEAADKAVGQAQRNTQLAAQAAGEYAQIAGGTRSQDLQQAQAQVDMGLNVANGISNAIGRDMQLTSEEAKFLGQMQIALEGLNVDWARLDEAQRAALVEEELRRKGLEQDWKMFKESQKVGVLDVVGAITGTARAGVSTYAQGKQSGLWG
jgi:hypothetical protein